MLYGMFNDTENLMDIYLTLETIGLTRGAGSQSLTSAWSDYNKCKMLYYDFDTKSAVTKTYDRYCMEFKACVKRINQLQTNPMNETGVATQFLEGCNLTGFPFSKNKRMEYLSLDILPDLNDVIRTITKARDVEAETNRKAVVPSTVPVRKDSATVVKPALITKAVEKNSKK
jgi:hypothetical protein